ncbi:MAG: hypothetical protein RXN78_04610 [Vulcanisaeta sp.]
MKFLEELMNLLFQEYGELILTIVSVLLSLVITTAFMGIVENELVLIKELNNVVHSINEAIG